jgi:hypothetical protein
VLALFALVMGGMYGGFFTPTEAAGVGAMGGFVFALARRALTWHSALLDVLGESARTSAMLFTIVIGASLFANYLNFTDLPNALKAASSPRWTCTRSRDRGHLPDLRGARHGDGEPVDDAADGADLLPTRHLARLSTRCGSASSSSA